LLRGLEDEFVWPSPTTASEKWRWEMFESVTEAMSQAVSKSKGAELLRWRVIETVGVVEKHLIQIMAKICNPEKDLKQLVSELARKSAQFWAVLGSQHYRVVIGPNPEKFDMTAVASLLQAGGSIELVVSPQLTRIGSAAGEGFDTDKKTIKEQRKETMSLKRRAEDG
jgi:hypothetical protein